jgi:hypothetical protein
VKTKVTIIISDLNIRCERQNITHFRGQIYYETFMDSEVASKIILKKKFNSVS